MTVWLYLVAAVFLFLWGLSFAFPTPRRIWGIYLRAVKWTLWSLGSAIGVRRAWAAVTGKPYVPWSMARMVRRFFEDLGTTFVKFGQVVASSPGIFPEEWVQEFQTCLDSVGPLPFPVVQRVLETELGPAMSRIVDIDPKPLASASIAQVHAGKLEDGREIVLKVQRPGIGPQIEADMQVLSFLARIAQKREELELSNPVAVVEDFRATIREELDFRREADNLDRFNDIQAELGNNDVQAPVPFRELSTSKVLVMERFRGVRIDDVGAVKASGVDTEERLIKGIRSWFQCVLFYGYFHGDVHAGNLMILDKTAHLGFLDFGIVGRFDETQRRLVTDYLIAFAMRDYKLLARTIVAMGSIKKSDIDLEAFSSDLERAYSPMMKLSMREISYPDLYPEIHRVAAKHRMQMPREFVLITKQLLYFDRYAKALAPNLNVFNDPRLVGSFMLDIQKARMQAQA